jgi:hypothetical protein
MMPLRLLLLDLDQRDSWIIQDFLVNRPTLMLLERSISCLLRKMCSTVRIAGSSATSDRIAQSKQNGGNNGVNFRILAKS